MCLMPTLASQVLKLNEAPPIITSKRTPLIEWQLKMQLRFNIFHHFALNLPTFHSFSTLDESHESDAIE